MSKALALRRFSFILEKATSDRYPSFAAIKSFLVRHGFEFSNRTLQRDLAKMDHLFQIKISYDRQKRAYFFDRDQSVNLDVFLRYLQMSGDGELVTAPLADGTQVLRHLSFGTSAIPAGSQWRQPITPIQALRPGNEAWPSQTTTGSAASAPICRRPGSMIEAGSPSPVNRPPRPRRCGTLLSPGRGRSLPLTDVDVLVKLPCLEKRLVAGSGWASKATTATMKLAAANLTRCFWVDSILASLPIQRNKVAPS